MKKSLIFSAIICSAMAMSMTSCQREEVNPSAFDSFTESANQRSASAAPSAPNRRPYMLKMSGGYVPMSCADSLDANTLATGESMICQITTNAVSSTIYTLTGTSAHCTFSIVMKDFNGGSIVAGDSIRITSCSYTMCAGSAYTLRTHATPVVTVIGNNVTVSYADCILPLNGTSGYVSFELVQP